MPTLKQLQYFTERIVANNELDAFSHFYIFTNMLEHEIHAIKNRKPQWKIAKLIVDIIDESTGTMDLRIWPVESQIGERALIYGVQIFQATVPNGIFKIKFLKKMLPDPIDEELLTPNPKRYPTLVISLQSRPVLLVQLDFRFDLMKRTLANLPTQKIILEDET
jgi:hypothetical protein